jgi:DNA-3-methyladenine glycosylase
MDSSILRRGDPPNPVPRSFYDRATVEVARDLLGRRLVRVENSTVRAGRIVETEAYVGSEDLACHAARGRTPRTAVMFGPPGFAYVYLVYGMHYCLNAVCEREGFPAAVLIRAIEPGAGIEQRTDGPGRVCRALGVDRSFNGEDLAGHRLFVECGDRPLDHLPADDVVACGPRVGVAYAGEWASRPWRFWLTDSKWVSRR